MKRMIAAACLLAVLSVGVFCAVGSMVSREKANVTITENVLYGDKAYANGVTVFTRAHYSDKLFWNTTYTIGDAPKTTTDFEFHHTRYDENVQSEPRGVTLYVDLQYGVNLMKPADACTGLEKAYRELYEATKPGTKGTKTIRLQDYYTYYPIRIGSMDLPGVMWNEYSYVGTEEVGNIRDVFQEFFKIPVPEDLPAFTISLVRDGRGNVIGSSVSGNAFDYWLNTRSAYTSDRVFFSINNKLDNTEGQELYVDTDLIPGGYGIYAFSYKNVRDSANAQGMETGIEEETLAMVFPLEQNAEVLYITVNNDESKLLLFTRQRGITHLTVIEIATMQQLQKIEITEAKQYTFYEYDNCIVLNGWEYISVIEKLDSGLCRLAFTVPRMEEVDGSELQKGVMTAMAYDGEKLVIIDRTGDERFGSLPLCGFTAAVYNAAGLLYYGEYQSSLSLSVDPSNYAYNCLPVRYSVRFAE